MLQRPTNLIFPEYPLEGDPLTSAWAQELNDYLNRFYQTFNVPGLITGVTATANNLTVVLKWNSDSASTLYRVYWSATGDFTAAQVLRTVAASKTGQATLSTQDSQDASTLTPTRYYWVQGVNERGLVGPQSAMASVSNFATINSTSTSVGQNALAAGERSVAIGVEASVTALNLESIAIGYQATAEFNNEFVAGSAAAPINLFGFVAGGHGQKWRVWSIDQQLNIAAAGSTDFGSFFGARDVVFGVDVRVLTTIPTATNFNVFLDNGSTQINFAAVSTAAGSNAICTIRCPYSSTTANAPYGIRIVPDLSPATNAGVVRVTHYWYRITPATS